VNGQIHHEIGTILAYLS